MKAQKKPTVTFFVSAYNEENNIKNFLRKVISQKEDGFILKKIIVVSDGSSDNTVNAVRSMQDSRIQLVDDKKRIGKSSRLNEIYRKFSTDILVQSDADVIFKDNLVIARIIKPIVVSKKVGLCGGNPVASRAKTFTEYSINITHKMYAGFRDKVRGGDNVFSADGRLLALSKPFARRVFIPSNMIANDMFAYFSCLSMGFEYRYVKDAIVYYRSPLSLRDHIKQNSRFEAGPIRMKRHFNADLVDYETYIPIGMLIAGMIKTFIRYPIHSLYIYIVNSYCRILASKTEKIMNAKWDIAYSTKTGI